MIRALQLLARLGVRLECRRHLRHLRSAAHRLERRITVQGVLVVAGCAGGLALVLAGLRPHVFSTAAFGAVAVRSSLAAHVVEVWFTWAYLAGCPLLALALANLLDLHGLTPGRRARWEVATSRPGADDQPSLLVGTMHAQDGSALPPSKQPLELRLNPRSLFCGVLCLGSVGSGKTAGFMSPAVRQYVSFHKDDPARKWAGLIIDAKGNWAEDIHNYLKSVGRGDDFYKISLPQARINLINRPDLNKTALAGALWRAVENVNNQKEGNFWSQSATRLIEQTLRLITLAGDVPTISEVYRVSCSEKAFEARLAQARRRKPKMKQDELEELESLEFFYTNVFSVGDAKTKANIAATVNSVCTMFDEPEIRRCFCPSAGEEDFPGWETLIEQGKVVVVSIPRSQYKQVSEICSTLATLAYMDAVLSRLAKAQTANADLGRACFLAIDEADKYVTMDWPPFLSQCREARCAVLVASQSRSGFLSAMGAESRVDSLFSNLRTKIVLSVEDLSTARDAAELCGKVEREKSSVSISENSRSASWSLLDRRSISEGDRSASTSTSFSSREEYLFRPSAFTKLQAFQAIVKGFDGWSVLDPWVVYLPRPEGVPRAVATKVG